MTDIAKGNAETVIRLDHDGKPAYVIMPWHEYVRLAGVQAVAGPDQLAEMTDEELYDLALAADEESVPADIVDRLLAGESPIKVWRDHRGMTQKDLAEAIGTSPVYLSQIERGRRSGSTKLLARIARSLDVELGDLVHTGGTGD